MAEFICRLGTPSGEVMTRVVEAGGASEAKDQLESEGFRVFKVESAEKGLSAVFSGGRGSKNRVKQGDFLLFNQQLSALLRAGIPVLQSIGLLKRRSASSALQKILADVEEKIKSGVSLPRHLNHRSFSEDLHRVAAFGRKVGALDDVLSRYVDYLKRSVGVSRKLRGALVIPLFADRRDVYGGVPDALHHSADVGSFQESEHQGRVADGHGRRSRGFFDARDEHLRLCRWGPSSESRFISGFERRTEDWFSTSFCWSPPLAGNLIRQMTVAQLARSLSTLLSGGITVPDAWDIASQAVGNLELCPCSQGVLPLIRECRGFAEALTQAGWMPELALDMVGIGEGSGSLREMLDEVANFYDAEAEVRMEQLMTLLEPVILVLMAVIVIVILLAIYMPIIRTISSGPFSGRGK
ncbi:MAG: type II secretion system F family protein [Acidobacteria bacterium]|nr:type II secretion system F family protein [Acidobacteriota bacterium]